MNSSSPRQEPSFGSSERNNNNGSSTRLPGLAGTDSEKQLTQREFEALRTIKRNVNTFKYGGWMIGAAGTYVLMNRRKPQPKMLSKLGWSVVGGLGGSFLTMPIGVLISQNALKDVEDPQHLRRVLAGAIEERRQGRRPQIGVAPPNGLNGEAEFGTGQQPQQQGQGQEWGGERATSSFGSFDKDGDNTAASAADSFNSFSSQSSSSGKSNGGVGMVSASTDASGTAAPPPGTGTGTRWAQLRGERGVEPSKWERIRQDNARTAYNRSTASQADQSLNSADPSASAPPQTRQQRPSPRSRDEPVMTLSGAEDDPRWSSPASFSPESSGWGNKEFLSDPAEQSSSSRSSRRGYGILSVLEEPRSSSTSNLQLESDAPIQVVKGTLLASLLGGVSGSLYGALRGRQGAGTILGTKMAVNSFAFAFPFFAVREYVISPVLNRTSSGPDPANRHMRLREVSKNRHTDNVLASGLAGAVVGAGVAGYARGVGAIHKGVVTFGMLCSALQLAGNEARVVRDAVIRPAPRAVAVPEEMTQAPKSPDGAVAVSQAAAPMVDVNANAADGKKASKSWLDKVKGAMPIRSVSDEEYESKLKERLSGVNQRMADVESEIREIEELIKQQEQNTAASN